MAEADNAKAGHRKRLKERFKKSGLDAFHDYEVVELLLTYAIPRRDVKPLAKELIRRFKGFKGVVEASFEELSAVKGVGENAASLILLIKEIAPAYLNEPLSGRPSIKSPLDVIEQLGRMFPAETGERLLAVYLNTKNEILAVDILHEGAIEEMDLSPAGLIDRAFRHNARSIIFIHTLPGKTAAATGSERGIARAFRKAASAVDIIIHDHIVAGDGGCYLSAREEGWW